MPFGDGALWWIDGYAGGVDEPVEAEGSLPVWGRPELRARARLADGVVHRVPGPWSGTVLALLRHVREVGFIGAPRVDGSGFDAKGAETLEFIVGDVVQEPFEWSTEAGFHLGVMLRDLHRATASFVPPAGAVFRPWFGRDLPGSDPVIGHCDTGPWNVIARGGLPVAFIDWEFAGPTDAMWELAQAGWLNAQLHDAAFTGHGVGLPDFASRAGVLRAILDGYEMPARNRQVFLDRVVEFIVCSARAKGRKYGLSPEASVGVADDGQPVAWDILWRASGAAWVLEHGTELHRSLA